MLLKEDKHPQWEMSVTFETWVTFHFLHLASSVAFFSDCSPPAHPVANRGLMSSPHHIPHSTRDTDREWVMDYDWTSVDGQITATYFTNWIFSELFVSSICWRRVNTDFPSGKRGNHKMTFLFDYWIFILKKKMPHYMLTQCLRGCVVPGYALHITIPLLACHYSRLQWRWMDSMYSQWAHVRRHFMGLYSWDVINK